MATISPYGDSRAHGSMGKALTFRRFRGRTRLSKHYNPKITHTPGQLTQRDKFSAAIYSLNRLNDPWKKFLYDRGVSTWQHGPNLYVSAHMKNRLPSTTPGIPMDALNNIVLFNPAGLTGQSIKITILTLPLECFCLLWNKHQDASLISEIGPDGVNGGATFVPGKWGNAARIDATGEGLSYSGLMPAANFNSFIYSWWMNTDYDVLDGHPQDSGWHTIFHFSFLSTTGARYVMMGIFPNIRKTFISDDTGYKIINTTVDWSASTWHKFILVRDRHANFDGSKTIALYFDGNEIGSTTDPLPDYEYGSSDIFRVGRQVPPALVINGMIDNPKIFGPVSANLLAYALSNQDSEDLPPAESMGHIYDSENVFTQEFPVHPTTADRIRIENASGDPERIPFDYVLTLHWLRQPDDTGTATIRLPRLELDPSTYFDLYIATDGSVYWDEAMTQLACTPKMYYAKTE